MIHFLCLLAVAIQQPQSPPADGLAMQELANGLRYRVDVVSDATHVCAVLGLRMGSDSDPIGRSGAAQVFAAALDARLPRAENRQAEVQVGGSGILVLRSVPVAELEDVLSSFRALLEGPLDLSEDEFALARARARLRADDETQVYPGRVLHWRARQSLLGSEGSGRPVCGIPAEIHALDQAELAAWQVQLLRPNQAFVLLLGGVDSDAAEDLLRAKLSDLPRGAAIAAFSGRLQEPSMPLRDTHQWVRAPFVSLALPAPESSLEDALAFAVGMSLVAKRTAFEFGEYRSGEARAVFPFLDYNFVDDQGFALINRRGFDGDPVERVELEIQNLLRPILEYGFSAREVGEARASLAAMRRIPPFSRQALGSMQRLWRMLYTRALVLAAYEMQDWPADLCKRLENVRAEDVNRVLRRQLAPDRSRWLILEPSERRNPAQNGS